MLGARRHAHPMQQKKESPYPDMTDHDAARQRVQCAHSITVLTGAGVSAESGIPTFRGAGGYWRNLRFEDLATPQGFARNP